MEQEIDYLILEVGRQVGLDIRYTVILDETASVLSSTDATRYPKGKVSYSGSGSGHFQHFIYGYKGRYGN